MPCPRILSRQHRRDTMVAETWSPRARWLHDLARQGAFDGRGRLRYDVRDPETLELHTAARDWLNNRRDPLTGPPEAGR